MTSHSIRRDKPRGLVAQINKTARALRPDGTVHGGLIEATNLAISFYHYVQGMIKVMDKKMHQVTKRIKTAAKDVKKGEPKAAVKVLDKAAKKNEKLVKLDRDVRDPMITKCKKEMKKGKK